MKKIWSFIVLLALALSFPVFCQEMPKDVKENDPYYDYVKDLVDRNIDVTQGFPDGTFRGDSNTTHYQAAYLMAKLALSLKRTTTSEIDMSDIEEEISWLRNEIKSYSELPEVKSAIAYYGSLDIDSKFGNLAAYDPTIKKEIGPEVSYRFKYSIEKEMGEDARLKINLDTMDGGFASSQARTFPLSLLDIEGDATADMGLEKPVYIKAVVGPGTVKHTDTSGVNPSENNTFYARPRPSFIVGTSMGGFDVSGMYAGRSISGFGQVGTSELNFQIGKKLGQVPVLGTTEVVSTSRYAFVDVINPPSSPNNFHEELSVFMALNRFFSHKMVLAMSSSPTPGSLYYFNYAFYLKDFNANGVDINFIFHSVGADYRNPFEKYEFLPLDVFKRKILDGTMDAALEVYHPLAGRFMLISRSDWIADSRGRMGTDTPGSSFTQELSLDYNASDNLNLNVFYRYYAVPSRLDQFLAAVPEVSDCLGFGTSYSF